MEIVILNDTIQDLEEIIVIALIIKMVGTRAAIWEKMEKQLNVMFVGQYITEQNLAQTLNKNQIKIKEGTNITLIVECMDTLIGETLSIAVLDSGYTKIVCSKTWLDYYLESVSSEELNNIKCERSETIFKFGNEKICHSFEWSNWKWHSIIA